MSKLNQALSSTSFRQSDFPVLLSCSSKFPETPSALVLKGTTGCLVFARSPDHAHAFSRQLQQHTVHKTYHALVNTSNSPTLTMKMGSGSIRVGMTLKDGRPHLSQSKSARETSTDWQVIGWSVSFDDIALVKLHLRTGMKHQLRVHMSDVLQAPILGDIQHTGTRPCTVPVPNDRLFLHASEISFHRYRRTGKQKRVDLTVRAPLPLDYMDLCIRNKIEVPSNLGEGGLFIDSQPMQEVKDLDGFWACRQDTIP
ncbi:pseudouridine synthase [Lentinula lateritia]|uniref:Pseudouridine synthase n=1 Tax=Lentinula lateritia TaxID=40482 RepID=A0ABQ8VVU3_9AGAR|nr:pseudouridine synthase [Lentinula lateritia]